VGRGKRTGKVDSEWVCCVDGGWGGAPDHHHHIIIIIIDGGIGGIHNAEI